MYLLLSINIFPSYIDATHIFLNITFTEPDFIIFFLQYFYPLNMLITEKLHFLFELNSSKWGYFLLPLSPASYCYPFLKLFTEKNSRGCLWSKRKCLKSFNYVEDSLESFRRLAEKFRNRWMWLLGKTLGVLLDGVNK